MEVKNPKVYQTKKISFSACHRLHSPHLNDEENKLLYGKCNHINGHGHNYTVFVTLYGEMNKISGMVLNMTELKDYMNDVIIKQLDHKNLDMDVDYFKNNPSTTENLSIFIWNELKKLMKQPNLLYEVKIYETENNSVYYRGD